MKSILFLIILIIVSPSLAIAQTYQIDWFVFGSGGGESNSASYQLNGTIGQPFVGHSSSAGYAIDAGFWVIGGIEIPTGYEYIPGDANMAAGGWEPIVIGADVTYLVNYFRGLSEPCLLDGFYASGDANGDCLVIGSDVTYLVNYFRGLNPIQYCPDYEPAWPPVPSTMPSGWPNCDPVVITSGDPNRVAKQSD